MGWTDPAGHVYAVGELLSAATLNTHLKDNLLDLHRRATVTADFVDGGQTTTSTSYTDLATTGPAVTVEIGSSGLALVCLYGRLSNSSTSALTAMSYAVSGATTSAADDDRAVIQEDGTANMRQGASAVIAHSGLAAGSNTFTAKYRVATGTGTFDDRRIAVIPLGS